MGSNTAVHVVPKRRIPSPQRVGAALAGVLAGALALSTLGMVAAAPRPGHLGAAVAGVNRPNIMVVMLDDMRADEMRFAPNTRRYIRERGLDFRNSFSPYPLCCPARASFLLGQYAHNHRVLYHDAPYGFGSMDDSVTIAGRMQRAGYRTALVGKYLNRYGVQPSRVTGRSSIRYVPAGWTDWMAGLDTTWPAGSPNAGNTYDYFRFTQNVNGTVRPHPGRYSSTVIADQVRGLISKYHDQDKPFFLWVTPVAPHFGGPSEPDDPRPVPDANGRRTSFPTPARPGWVKGRFDSAITHALGQPAHGPAERDVSDKPRNIRKFPEARPVEKLGLREMERQRAEAIFAWDREFGRIVARLKTTGEFANTVLVFTSDNGYFNGEHRQRSGKIKAHEPVLRVPLVVAGPGIQRGVRYNPITTVDLTPTLLELAGAAALPAMDGRSKVPVMRGPDQAWTTAVVTEGLLTGVHRVNGSGVPAGLKTSGLRVGRYKLIRYASGETELYDLLGDPLELNSVWTNPGYRAIRTQMTALWAQYRSCATRGCRVALPADLRTTPDWLAAQFQHAERAKRNYYD